jgi:transcription initiation factor TFIID subunit 5
LLSAATDKTIKLWCLRTKILLLNFKSHSNIIWSVKFSDSGYFFASSSADKTVKLWKTDNSSPIRVMLGHNSDVYKV